MTTEQAAAVFAAMGDRVAEHILRSQVVAGEAYRNALKVVHPDVPGTGSTKDFHRLQEARRVLDQYFGGAR